MSVDSSYLDFVAYLPRPKSVDDWSDTTEILERHVAALVATLDGRWTCDGPVDEADSLFMTATRSGDGARAQTIWFSFDYLDGAATMPRAVPDPMRFDVRVQEEPPARAPWRPATTQLRRLTAPVAVGLAGAALVSGLMWRAAGWFVPSLAFALALVGLVVARRAVPVWAGGRPQPLRTSRAASPELLALAAAVERYLRASFTDVRLVDDED